MFNPFSAITAKIYGIAAIAFLTFAIVQTARIEGFLFWDGLYEQLGDARERVKAYETGFANATKERDALFKQVSDKQRNIARLTDENETNRLKLASAADAYARRMRWQDHSRTEAGPATESNPAQSGDSPDPDAVILSRADFDILNANTARLMDVKAWGEKLIEEGLADVYQDN